MSSSMIRIGRMAALLCVASTLVLATDAQMKPLTPHVPKMVAEGRAQRVAALPSSQQQRLVISLPLRNEPALEALLADLYNPQSPNYRHWLTPSQFDAQFGPTVADYAALTNWARNNGLTITAITANRRILSVEGTTGLVNLALHIQETHYHDTVLNREFQAPDREPTLDLAIPVLGISGLDTSNPKVNYHMKKPEPVVNGLSPFITPLAIPKPEPQIAGSGPGNTYIPSDMRAAYYGGTALTGAGQHVDIYSYDSVNTSDVTAWYTHVSATTPVSTTVPVTIELVNGFSDGSCPGTSCDDTEQVLDILQVQGMAPGLSGIYFYESDSAVAELNQMASDDNAAAITSSWGGGDFGPACDPALLQMATQGQTYFNATGDSGAFNGFTYYPPSLDPYMVQVGGTDLTTSSKAGPWSSETAWADSGGGFFDPNITIPTWQQTAGVITSTNKGSTTMRNSPDMAAEANFDNTSEDNGKFETGYGGTSYATPRMAGYMALVNQQSVANGTGTIGFINPALYQFGLSATKATIFHDITSGSAPSSYAPNITNTAVAGYDIVTGWGSPNTTGLINALTGPDFAVSTATTTAEVDRSSNITVNIAITPKNGFTGPPTFTATGLPAGVTASFGTVSGNAVGLKLTSGATTVLATATVTVTGTYNSVSHSTTFVLTAGKRASDDFTLSATAATLAQMASGSSTVTFTPGSGFSGPVSLAVSGLPAGVTAAFNNTSTFSTSTLTFTATIASAPGTYSAVVTASGPANAVVHSIPVAITLAPAASVVVNGGFETGATSPWNFTSTTTGGAFLCNEECGFFQHSGSWFAYLNGFGAVDTDTLTQSITIPTGKTTATLNLWLLVYSQETSATAKNDTFTIEVLNSSGTALATLASFSNLDKASAYSLHSYDMSAYIGQTVTLQFQGIENKSLPTAFLLDDISVVVQ